MKHISDDDLVLLYYGEHDDPGLAARVAQSEELTTRFRALSAELDLADGWAPPSRGEDFGARLWRDIAPRLAQQAAGPAGAPAWRRWLAALGQPRLSLASAMGLAMVTVVAFMLGRGSGVPPGAAVPPGLGAGNPGIANLDAGRLLKGSVADHLGEVDLVLTRFVHAGEPATIEADWATDMLLANRLYRQVAASSGQHRLAAFLSDLEPLLIELAHQAHMTSTTTRERMQQEIKDGLLFRVRVLNQNLKSRNIAT